MSDFFKGIDPVSFKGPDSDDPLAFRFYDRDRPVLGKPMREQLRMAVAYWHSFAWPGGDPFGGQTFERPWFRDGMSAAELKAEVAFEMFQILGVDFFTFHDRDVAPEGRSLAESDRNVRAIADIFAAKSAPSGRMSASWKQKNGWPRIANISKAASAFSLAWAMSSPNHGRSKVWPPNGSPPGQAKLCHQATAKRRWSSIRLSPTISFGS